MSRMIGGGGVIPHPYYEEGFTLYIVVTIIEQPMHMVCTIKCEPLPHAFGWCGGQVVIVVPWPLMV